MSKRLGGIIGCKYKTSPWHLNGFPILVTLGQQYNIGEKPTVILYTYINRHAGTLERRRMAMELVIYGTRQFGIKEYFFWMRWLLRS